MFFIKYLFFETEVQRISKIDKKTHACYSISVFKRKNTIVLAFVTALPAEAKPLIGRFELKRIDSPFPLYKQGNIYLVVSGVGKMASAIATTFLQTHLHSTAAYLNIGIAGHKTLEVSTAVMASKVIDKASSYTYYPTFLTSSPCPTHTFCSVDQPEFTFADDSVYEMEAAGFVQAASKFSSSELIHCYKVISDNLSSPAKIDPIRAEELITDHLPQIQSLSTNLLRLIETLPSPSKPSLEPWKHTHHFTKTEELRLQRLLQRFVCIEKEISFSRYAHLRSAKEVLSSLEQDLLSLTWAL